MNDHIKIRLALRKFDSTAKALWFSKRVDQARPSIKIKNGIFSMRHLSVSSRCLNQSNSKRASGKLTAIGLESMLNKPNMRLNTKCELFLCWI